MTYSATTRTKGTVPLPIMGFRVPINEEIWLPLVRWALNPVIWDVVTGHRHLFCLI